VKTLKIYSKALEKKGGFTKIIIDLVLILRPKGLWGEHKPNNSKSKYLVNTVELLKAYHDDEGS